MHMRVWGCARISSRGVCARGGGLRRPDRAPEVQFFASLSAAATFFAFLGSFGLAASDRLEPSTALFAAYAVEAGMLVHRLARRGLLTFKTAVPLYGFGVLPVLTLLPMGCLFWWKFDEVSFWDFLFLSV